MTDLSKKLPSNNPSQDHIAVTDELNTIREIIIFQRNLALERGDMVSAVELSHAIAAINTGCIIQVRTYVADTN